MSTKYSKLAKNTALMVIGNFSSKLLTFFLVPLYTCYLTTSEYGIADLMTTTISLLIPFLTLTAAEGILRMALDKEMDNKQVFSIAVYISLTGFALLLVVFPFVANWISFSDYYLFFIMYYFFYVAQLITQQFAKGLECIEVFVISGIIATVVTCVLSIILLVFFKAGIIGYLISLISGYAISALYIVIKERLWSYLLSIKKIKVEILSIILAYCLPLIPNSVSWWVSNSSDKYILTFFWGVSVTGIYSVAYKIPSIIAMMSGILTSAWQISAIENFGSEESASFFSDIYNKYASVYIIVCSGVILFIKILAKFLFVGEFYNAWQFSTILVLASLFQAMGAFLGIIYAAAKKTKTILYTTVLGAIANIILNLALIPAIGAVGAAIATLISYAVIWLSRVIDTKKLLPIKTDIKQESISYGLIIIQILVTNLSLSYWFIWSGIINIILNIMHRKTTTKLIVALISKIVQMRRK